METFFFAILGWSGMKFKGWRLWLAEPDPVPWKPQPVPWKYAFLSSIGIIVGIAAGLFFKESIANDALFAGQEAISSGLFSFAASNIVTGLASTMMKEKAMR
ncbi:hypothetical protein [Flavobacterium humi]|uniref:Uncharacterized protein n=1 Tax=Flavobacterium humi TaxID=2562683 RepID=A0A4Z0LD58_9FLAO|nr:hypothetical protein [Flavobacterium humi]TGD59818.1 hypothetical protein E4635_02490 [Flavobacterium humi]